MVSIFLCLNSQRQQQNQAENFPKMRFVVVCLHKERGRKRIDSKAHETGSTDQVNVVLLLYGCVFCHTIVMIPRLNCFVEWLLLAFRYLS